MPSRESALVNGRTPRCVHVLLRRYVPSALPRDDAGLDTWCKERFVAKEAVLRGAYTEGGGAVEAAFAPRVSFGASAKPSIAAMPLGRYAWMLGLYAAVLPGFVCALLNPLGLAYVCCALGAVWGVCAVSRRGARAAGGGVRACVACVSRVRVCRGVEWGRSSRASIGSY